MRWVRWSLAVLLAGVGTSAHALTCPRPGPPDEQVVDVSEPVAIDRSKGIAELTFLRRPGPGLHSNGLYTSTLHAKLEVRFDIVSDGRMACIAIDQVRAETGWQARTIHIARDYPSGGCEARAILDHERRHVNADERLLTQEFPALRNTVDRLARAATAGPIVASQIERTKRRLTDEINAEFRRAVENFNIRRNAVQATIDSPTEYERVRRMCPDGW
jgi:hypothetical protein